MMEMGDFFTKDEILKKGRAVRIGSERILIIERGTPWLVVSAGYFPPEAL
jgi:hypothetical protein